MNKQLITLIALLFLFTSSAMASEGKKRKGAYLNISATESVKVVEDLLLVNLRFEAEGKSVSAVQEKINKTMGEALSKAKSIKNAEISTEQYSVYKYHPRVKKGEKKKTIWRGAQHMKISGKSADDILKMTGELQKMGLATSNLGYVVSPEKHEETRDALMEKAIKKLLTKSDRVAKAIGKKSTEVVNINIDSNHYQPLLRKRSKLMAMSAADSSEKHAPVAEPGQGQVTMTVSATILIKD